MFLSSTGCRSEVGTVPFGQVGGRGGHAVGEVEILADRAAGIGVGTRNGITKRLRGLGGWVV